MLHTLLLDLLRTQRIVHKREHTTDSSMQYTVGSSELENSRWFSSEPQVVAQQVIQLALYSLFSSKQCLRAAQNND
jgi:hypothetical protein